ncbi:GNAT family N-acetyltransferase [Paenibacillus tepidiphilus]|uniref:GNAT family N-acetyltransferase n=1 Tax=Paenibacillus tepidiphilus TaxID=2608683 RepID=UPI003B845146
MDIVIKIDSLQGPEIIALLEEHLRGMHADSPPESVHALDLDGLRKPEITFYSAWIGGELAGCGAVKELDPKHGELKSMRTSSAFIRKGVARAIVEHIIEEARKRGYSRLSLETGTPESFLPAVRLYESFGFKECGPFAGYSLDPYSKFMTKEI